ncbi:MAG: DUF1318 domain-containing protein [bacterium]|nr:DUF1318 domain-containing protein [bacterium]
MKQWLWLSLLAGACSLQAPEIKVTGERSLLEKQVLGSYQSFGREMWMATSLRGLPDSMATAGERENLLKSIRRRRFNQDDRLRLLAAGQLGENRDGRLELLAADLPPGSERSLLERVVEQDNQDREVLLARLRRLYPEQDAGELARLFAAIQQDEAPRGARIQRADGSWTAK